MAKATFKGLPDESEAYKRGCRLGKLRNSERPPNVRQMCYKTDRHIEYADRGGHGDMLRMAVWDWGHWPKVTCPAGTCYQGAIESRNHLHGVIRTFCSVVRIPLRHSRASRYSKQTMTHKNEARSGRTFHIFTETIFTLGKWLKLSLWEFNLWHVRTYTPPSWPQKFMQVRSERRSLWLKWHRTADSRFIHKFYQDHIFTW